MAEVHAPVTALVGEILKQHANDHAEGNMTVLVNQVSNEELHVTLIGEGSLHVLSVKVGVVI